MKKTLFLLLLLLNLSASATPVDPSTARTVAMHFLRAVSKQPVGELVDVTSQTPWNEFYIFNIGSDTQSDQKDSKGFVIVAADNCVIPILAYSTNYRFNTKNMPPNLRSWMQGYEDQIAWWRNQMGDNERPASDPNAYLQDWDRLLSDNPIAENDDVQVGPFLTTTWHQNNYYNERCPDDNRGPGNHVYAGCEATAAGQIMKKWNFPSQGHGAHSYTHPTYGIRFASFGTTTYDWDNMPNELTFFSSSAEKQAVSTLLYHIGVAVHMKYGANESSSFPEDAVDALRNYFKYSIPMHLKRYADCADNEWKVMLRDELDQGRPIFYYGNNELGTHGGHAFVCDGYKSSTGQFYINWGWGGNGNEWYSIGSLNPNSTQHYNLKNGAIFGIEPNYSFGGNTIVTANSNNTNYGNIVITATSNVRNYQANYTGNGTYYFGDTVKIWAIAQSGSHFIGWSDGYKHNPRFFVSTGGSVNFTAQFEPLSGDTLSYCTGNTCTHINGESNGTYWGMKLPNSILNEGTSLRKVQMYAVEAGIYTLSVYSGGTTDADLRYTEVFTIASSDTDSWKTIPLVTPVDIDGTEDLYITFYNNDATKPTALTYYSGNDDGFLVGRNFSQIIHNPFSFMIRGVFGPSVYQDDTISYCGDSSYLNQYGMDGGTSWGISFSPTQLSNCDYFQSVLLYTPAAGTYTLNVYSGNESNPTTLLYTHDYIITDPSAGYKRLYLNQPLFIDHTQHLWVTFHNTDVASPAAVCRYTGDPRSRWILYNSNWVPLNDVAPSLNFSWMIKLVIPSSSNNITASACDSYIWHETTYTESGDYTYTYTDDNGDPQADILHLTINHPAHAATTVTANNSYSWHGLDYYYSGDYLHNLIDANHCTQVDTLHLTITNPLNNVMEYWFDQTHDTRMAIVVNSTDWQGQIDVSSLDFGLHTLYMHLRDNEGRCSPPRSALFYKGFDGNMSYTCWFDQNFASQQTIPFADNSMQVDVNWLNDGLHTLNMQIGNGVSAELHSYIFFKMPFEGCSDLVYTCWFDRDYNLRVSGQLSTGTLLLNTDGLTDGLHILNMITGSGATAELRSYVFYKIPSNASLADASTLLYHYSIDGVQQPTLQVSPQNRMIHLNLDVDNTGEGLHSLTGCLMTSNGSSMALHSSWFYTVPAGGEGISRYEYWLNDDFENRTVVDVTPFVDTLQVITLLQLDTLSINSNDFEFDPNGGNPVIRSRNNITFRFWNSALRMTSATRQYVDQRMVETILTDTLERDTTKFFATPGTGQIHWFKLESGVGDSMSFHTNSRCTMQLYTPSGEMVIQASGDSVLTWKGCRVWENGVCYLAIHDAEGSGDMSVSYDFYENQHCHSTINVTACDSYNWNGETYTSSGTHVYSTIGHGGCDSVATLHLTIYTSNSAAETVTACNSYTWHGSTYTASTTTPTYTTTNAVGCDSVTTLHLTVNYSTSSTETVTACDSYTWHGSTYTASTTTPTYTTTNVVGCDSVTTLHLTVNYSSSNTETVTACDSYTWHGTIYNTSTTTATYTTTNAVGCDSVTTLHLTISYSDTTTETVTACDSLIWHNSTYTASTTTPTYTTTNAFGCDSVTTLHLTINYSDTTTETVTACDSIIWHDSIYTASTLSPQFITLNAAGCDSTVTLHLTINYSSYNTIVDTGVNHYEWQGNTYTESGEYVYEGLTEVGCDSIIVLQLIITEVGIGTNDSLSGIILCPNPTTGKLTIAADGISLVEVFDPNGRNVATFHDTNVIDISHLPTGAYSLRITLRNGTSVKRVIKH